MYEGSEEKQLFALEYLPEEMENIEKKKFLTFKFINRYFKRDKTQTFKRPFLFQCKELKGSQLYDRVCDFFIYKTYSSLKREGKDYENKFGVFRQKIIEEKLFLVCMSFGNSKEEKNNLTFEHNMEIKEDTNVAQLLEKYNFEVEFEVYF